VKLTNLSSQSSRPAQGPDMQELQSVDQTQKPPAYPFIALLMSKSRNPDTPHSPKPPIRSPQATIRIESPRVPRSTASAARQIRTRHHNPCRRWRPLYGDHIPNAREKTKEEARKAPLACAWSGFARQIAKQRAIWKVQGGSTPLLFGCDPSFLRSADGGQIDHDAIQDLPELLESG
jgi:hypothetical protein